MTNGHGKLGRSVAVTLVGTAVPPLAALATAPILARGLGLEARGEVAAAQAVCLLAIAVTGFGIPEAVTFFTARGARGYAGSRTKMVGFSVLTGVAASCLVLALSQSLSGGDPLAQRLIDFAGWSVAPSLVVGVFRADAAGRRLWNRIAGERLLSSAFRLAGAVALFSTHTLTPHSATALVAFAPLIGVLPYALPSPARSVIEGQTPTSREVARYGLLVWLGAVSGILLMRIDQALLTPLAGVNALGLYTVAVAISELPLVINSAVRDVIFAHHSGTFDPHQVARAGRMSGGACVAAAAALAAMLPWLVPDLFGSDFRGSISVSWVLLGAVVIGTPGSIAGAGLSALGRPGARSASLGIAAVINVLALLIMVPAWGALGAAWATMAGNLVSSNLNIAWFRVLTGIGWRDFHILRRADFTAAFASVGSLAGRLSAPRSRQGGAP